MLYVQFQKVPLHKFVAQGKLNDLIEVASKKKLDVNSLDEVNCYIYS